MILLLGTDQDPTTLYFEDFLKEKNISYFFLNQRMLFNGKVSLFGDYILNQDQKYYYTDFSGVLNRMSGVNSSDISNVNAKDVVRSEYILSYILSYKLKNVMNPNHCSISNDSKLYQLGLLSPYMKNIKIPESLVLKGLDVEEYLPKHSKASQHIVKSLSSIRSIVKEYETSRDIFTLSKSSEPVLFQEFLDGVNVRVHVIDEHICAVKILSDTVDYRYDNTIRKFERTEIPKEIEKECIAISKGINLRFAGIDLLLTKGGEYYIFEVNPSPGYSYFEQEIDSKFMSEKLLESLLK